MSRLLSTKCVANSIITGIVNSVIMLLHAVSDTDNATSPLAIMEKMLDELPPGEQAMSMMPIKNRGSSWKTCPKANASIGSRMIWPASPAIMGRGRLRNSLKSSVCNVSPSSNINKVRMLVSGCSSQSTDDIYQMMENASSKSNGSESSGQSDMVSDNSPRVYTEDYKECNKNYMPELVQTGETAKVTIGSRNDTLSFTVTDALITDDFSDLRQLTSQAAYDNIRNFLLYVETDDYIDEQGNILDSERGVERKALFVKLSIKNENNSEYTLPIHSLSLYSIKKENSVMKYRRLKGTNDGGPICANAPDAFTLKSASKITLQPGEEKEEVLIYFEEDKWVEQYTYRYDKDIGKGVYGDLVYGDDISYDNIYFSTSFMYESNNQNKDRGYFEKIKSLIKLDIRQE